MPTAMILSANCKFYLFQPLAIAVIPSRNLEENHQRFVKNSHKSFLVGERRLQTVEEEEERGGGGGGKNVMHNRWYDVG